MFEVADVGVHVLRARINGWNVININLSWWLFFPSSFHNSANYTWNRFFLKHAAFLARKQKQTCILRRAEGVLHFLSQAHPVYQASQVRRSLSASPIALDFQFQDIYFIFFPPLASKKNVSSAFQPIRTRCLLSKGMVCQSETSNSSINWKYKSIIS